MITLSKIDDPHLQTKKDSLIGNLMAQSIAQTMEASRKPLWDFRGAIFQTNTAVQFLCSDTVHHSINGDQTP